MADNWQPVEKAIDCLFSKLLALLAQLFELFSQLRQLLLEFRDPFLFLCDHFTRCIVHKFLIVELSATSIEISLRTFPELREARPFGVDVDQALHWDKQPQITE